MIRPLFSSARVKRKRWAIGLQRGGNKNAPHEAGRNRNHEELWHYTNRFPTPVLSGSGSGVYADFPRLSAVWHPQQLQRYKIVSSAIIALGLNLNELPSI
jgi:hypothetical protein